MNTNGMMKSMEKKADFADEMRYLEKTRNTEEEKKNGSKVGQRGT